MRNGTIGNVTLMYSPESEPLAPDLLAYADRCNRYLADLFRPEQPVRQQVNWLAKRDWRGKPESYGFPCASGANAILAAADVDLPTQLALIADSMDIDRGGPAITAMAKRLGLPATAVPGEVHRQLKESSAFFVVFTGYFILPHELTHGYCNVLGYPSQPRWFYEGLAQWAAFHIDSALRSPADAEMIYDYYQLLWDRGKGNLRVQDFAEADRLGAGGLDTPNYAWYHAGLLRLFRELETMKGTNLLPDLVCTVGARYRGQRHVPPADMIQTVSTVVGRDLHEWFAKEWGLGPEPEAGVRGRR